MKKFYATVSPFKSPQSHTPMIELAMPTLEKEKKTSRAEQKKLKIAAIFKAAMDLLQEGGLEKLTMRRVADKVGMSLGNLQFHFKTKEVLLSALLGHFLEQYLEENWGNREEGGESSAELHQVFYDILTHDSFETVTLIFKEIWAASGRHSEVGEALKEYYRKLHGFIGQLICQTVDGEVSGEQAEAIADILMPFFEGYCLTRHALAADPAQLSKRLEVLSLHLMGNK